ncbi:hypothetical protein KCP77_11820 [Salmonella enterica subsp. enterica]|nr:hypothetical protein KCP77_11820 [Salmonella enterica subsp. enterica]
MTVEQLEDYGAAKLHRRRQRLVKQKQSLKNGSRYFCGKFERMSAGGFNGKVEFPCGVKSAFLRNNQQGKVLDWKVLVSGEICRFF